MPGFEAVRTVCGPLGRSVTDIELGSRVVFGRSGANYDPVPLPYRDVKLPDKLGFGYYASGKYPGGLWSMRSLTLVIDDFVKASPVCRRAVLETVDALRRQGHECIEFKVPERE